MTFDRARTWLASPRAVALIVVLGTLLAAPSLIGGYASDDHIHRIVMRDATGIPGLSPGALDLFVFADGDPANMKALMDKGVFPWTTHPELRLAFARPASALTHRLDDALWSESPLMSHLHSLAWFALLLVIIGGVYRRMHRALPWVAGLAMLMYAIDDGHGPTVSWIANRAALISACFGFGALIAHDRWRRDGWRQGRVVAPALLALALLAGEAGLAVTAYLFCYALFLERADGMVKKLGTLSAYVAVAAIWMVAYKLAGYGVSHSGAYLDPGGEPGQFLIQTATYLPVLLTSQLTGLISDFFNVFSGDVANWYWIGCLVYLVLLLDGVKTTLAHSAEARFWASSMVLSAIPVCTTFPGDRLLIFVGVGAMGLVACFLHAPEGRMGRESKSRIRAFSVKGWTVGLVLAHLIVAPLLMPVRAGTMRSAVDSLERSDQSIPNTPDVVDKTIIAVNPPGDAQMAYIPLMRASRRAPIPGRQRWLAVGQTKVTVTREDAFTLAVQPEGGYLNMVSERLGRSLRDPLAVGHTVELAGVTVEVTALTADGRPGATRWRFDRPLEDPSFVWLRWGDDHLRWVPFVPPPIGTSVELPRVDGVTAFFGDGS